MRDKPLYKKDKLIWKWLKGSTTSSNDLGDPLSTTDYELCVFDQIGGVDALVLKHLIPAGNAAKWMSFKHGFKYKDPTLSNDGILSLYLRDGLDGRARIVVKGKGEGLSMTPLPMAQDAAVTVQMSNGIRCWEARYSTYIKSDDVQFKSKADP